MSGVINGFGFTRMANRSILATTDVRSGLGRPATGIITHDASINNVFPVGILMRQYGSEDERYTYVAEGLNGFHPRYVCITKILKMLDRSKVVLFRRMNDPTEKKKGLRSCIFGDGPNPGIRKSNAALLETFKHHILEAGWGVIFDHSDERKKEAYIRAYFELVLLKWEMQNLLMINWPNLEIDMNEMGRVAALILVQELRKADDEVDVIKIPSVEAIFNKIFISERRKVCSICGDNVVGMINSVCKAFKHMAIYKDENILVTERDKGKTNGGVDVPARVYSDGGRVYVAWVLRNSDNADYKCSIKDGDTQERFTVIESARSSIEAHFSQYVNNEIGARVIYHSDQSGDHFHFTCYSNADTRFIKVGRRNNGGAYQLSPMILDVAVRALNLCFRLIKANSYGAPVIQKNFVDVPLPLEIITLEADSHTDSGSKQLALDIFMWLLGMYASMSLPTPLLDKLEVHDPRLTTDDIWHAFEQCRQKLRMIPLYQMALENANRGNFIMLQDVYRMWQDRNVFFPYNLCVLEENTGKKEIAGDLGLY